MVHPSSSALRAFDVLAGEGSSITVNGACSDSPKTLSVLVVVGLNERTSNAPKQSEAIAVDYGTV